MDSSPYYTQTELFPIHTSVLYYLWQYCTERSLILITQKKQLIREGEEVGEGGGRREGEEGGGRGRKVEGWGGERNLVRD